MRRWHIKRENQQYSAAVNWTISEASGQDNQHDEYMMQRGSLCVQVKCARRHRQTKWVSCLMFLSAQRARTEKDQLDSKYTSKHNTTHASRQLLKISGAASNRNRIPKEA